MAFLLAAGSVLALISCRGASPSEPVDVEALVTQRIDTLTRIQSENGRKSYRFRTPLLESHDLASEPYTEFPRGIHIETFKDSTGTVESILTADYAIFWTKKELWEAKGNVKAVNADGRILETQQLFWDQRTQKIYSNVDTKVTEGEDVMIGVGFESDESLNDLVFRRPRGKVSVDVEPTREQPDSAAAASGVPPAGP